MSTPTVIMYVKKLTDEQVKSVQEPYYAKEALKELIDSCANRAAREHLADNYTTEYSKWKAAMDTLEKEVLKDWYQGFVYDFTITFGDGMIALRGQFDDAGLMNTITTYLQQVCGFKTTNTKIPGPLKDVATGV